MDDRDKFADALNRVFRILTGFLLEFLPLSTLTCASLNFGPETNKGCSLSDTSDTP